MPGQLIGRLLGLPAYRDKTTAFVLTAQQTIYRAIIVLLTVTAILWMAVFLYVAFYYSYMPAISHTRPVHLQFDSCGRTQGICSYPSANVTLTRRQQLLMVGQPYRVLVELEMPESQRNRDAGMFMVCLEMKSGSGDTGYWTMGRACRATMLHYKSPLLQYILTATMSPFLLSGSAEEKQMVQVELFSGFEEDPGRPVTEAMVQVRSQHVEVYKVALRIHAHFTGLRYFMFHWPVLSAFLGIMTNLLFLSVIAFLSWYKYFTPKQVVVHLGYDSGAAKTLEERRQLAKERLMRERSKLVSQKSEETKGKAEEEPEVHGQVDQEVTMSKKKEVASQVGGGGKEELEKPEEDEETRRTSEEYEVIKKEEEEEEEDDGQLFTEVDKDKEVEEVEDLKKKKGGDEEKEEDDKENFPKVELRQRKKQEGKKGDEEEDGEDGRRSSTC